MSANRKVKLIRISPKTLVVGEKFEYNIFEHHGGDVYKKFLVQNEEYTLNSLNSIEHNNIKHLYVTYEDFKKYINKSSNYLSKLVNDKDVDLLIKSEVLYQISSEVMYELLTGSVTKDKIAEVTNSVDVAVELVFKEPEAIKAMIQVTTHEYDTHTHSVDVATYALGFGYHLGLEKTQLKKLVKGAMLHDIGKKRIPDEIISKNGALSDQEFRIIKNHPSYGIDILREIGENDNIVLSIVEEHHEKANGSGYPRALTLDKIHLFAQIVSICDIFNAITTKRSYKDQKKSFDALKLMHAKMKDELNPKLFAKFISFMGDR